MSSTQDAHTLNADADTFGAAFIDIAAALGRYDATDDEVAGIITLLALEPGSRVLDAGCGPGRISEALASQGIAVTGVDLSESALEIARTRPGARAEYLLADLAQPLPVPPQDGIVSIFSSFGFGATRADDQEVLRNWFAALRPGGGILMELSDVERARARLGVEGTPIERTTNGVTEVLCFESATGILQVIYKKDDEILDTLTRLYSETEILGMLADSGFEDLQVFGGLDRRPRTPLDRLVVSARRPN